MGPIPVAARLRPLLRRGSLDRGMSHEGAAGSQLFVSRGGRPREEAKPRRLDLGLSVSRAVDGRRLLRKPPGEQRFARSWPPEGTGTGGHTPSDNSRRARMFLRELLGGFNAR